MGTTVWKFSGYYKQDPEKVKQEIDKLGESFTMHDIVDMARGEDHFMHDMFEWDDSIAGEKYREQQAGLIVRMLVFRDEETEKPTPVRVFYSASDEPRKYSPTTVIIRQPDAYKTLLEQALIELRAFQRKYSSLSELSDVFDAIDAL